MILVPQSPVKLDSVVPSIVGAIAALTLASSLSVPAKASTPPKDGLTYRRVERQIAAQRSVKVVLYPGRITSIDFSPTDEVIVYTGLGDRSRTTYSTDLPLESAQAQTLFLTPIETLDFPGATRASVTNLVVKTLDPLGTSRTYSFEIVHAQSPPQTLGVRITPGTPAPVSDGIDIGRGRTATLDEVEFGLELAIAHGYTKPADPVVLAVKNFLALARQNLTAAEAARTANAELAVVVELARIAYDRFDPPPELTTSAPDGSGAKDERAVQIGEPLSVSDDR